MKRQELWQAYVRKNPLLEGEGKVQLSKSKLKAIVEDAWDKGFSEGNSCAKGFDNIFGNMFGRR